MKKYILLAPVLVFAACAPKMQIGASHVAQKLTDNTSCANYKTLVWDGLYASLKQNNSLPDSESVELALREVQTKLIAEKNMRGSDSERLIEEVGKLYQLIKDKGDEVYKVENTTDSVLQALAKIEVEDQETEGSQELQSEIHQQLEKIKALSDEMALECVSPAPDLSQPSTPQAPVEEASPTQPTEKLLLPSLEAKLNPAVFNATKLIGVAYQSCEAMTRRGLIDDDKNVEGITITGQHSDGVGSKRSISNLNALLKSHFYLHDYKQPKKSCYAITSNPLIYDYGGKPYTLDNMIDLFQNGGSGTKVLGIDCSGFVFSSLASAGLKVKSSSTLRAQHVSAYSSRSFKDPKGSGMDCIQHASFTQTTSLKEGDIGAINGHVFMMGYVGSDPFGLNRITSVKKCTKSQINYQNFDFDILQSSNSKNGIGINRFRGPDYLAEHSETKDAMVEFAVQACKAKFQTKAITPKVSYLSVVRHSGAAQCKAGPVAVAKQECLSECRL